MSGIAVEKQYIWISNISNLTFKNIFQKHKYISFGNIELEINLLVHKISKYKFNTQPHFYIMQKFYRNANYWYVAGSNILFA